MEESKSNDPKRRNRRNRKPKTGQPKADSADPRVNFDNTRESKFEKDIAADSAKSAFKGSANASNDVRWYATNPELLKAAGNLTWYSVVGSRMPWSAKQTVPGVLAVEFSPALDIEAINVAANQHYSFTVHANSRNYKYDAPDQMMTIIAGAQAFSCLASGIRVFGLMRQFEQIDSYTPRALVEACGFNYADLQEHLSDMWFDLNLFISEMKQIWIPNNMSVIERWFWMNTNVYRDEQSHKAQYYLYKQSHYLQFSETGNPNGTSLTIKEWGANKTWAQYKQFMYSLINALIHSQDRGIIFGDILKAYGPERIYSVSPITSDYVTTVVYDAEVLSQIENSQKCVVPPCGYKQNLQWGAPTIIADSGFVPVPKDHVYAKTSEVRMINFHQVANPTPEQIMVATRLQAPRCVLNVGNYPSDTTKWSVQYIMNNVPTEIVTNYKAFYYTFGDNGKQLDSFDVPTNSPETSVAFDIIAIMIYRAFDWAPAIYHVPGLVLPSDAATTRVFNLEDKPRIVSMEYDNYCDVGLEVVGKQNKAAVMAEFGVNSQQL